MIMDVIGSPKFSTIRIRNRIWETNVASSILSRLNAWGFEEHACNKILMFEKWLSIPCLFPWLGPIENGSEQKSFLNLIQRQKENIIHICSKYNVGFKLVLKREFTQPLICNQFWKVPFISAEAMQALLLFWADCFLSNIRLI